MRVLPQRPAVAGQPRRGLPEFERVAEVAQRTVRGGFRRVAPVRRWRSERWSGP
ncbi:hypothetical protein [Microbispora hainanensis]|uniref:hypothetical protein n=1 Tax=Microbispora hainanensis TaxID=568844 RepID=UPI00142F228F|nr:hypothetical protein [Microbispora hainanensis]